MAWLVLLPAAAASQSPDDLKRAGELLQAGKIDESIAIYENRLRQHPADPAVLVNLAIAEYKAARYDAAARHCEAALRSAPGSFPAMLFLGASRLQSGDTAGAIRPLEAALALQPSDRNARLMLASALLAAGRAADAAPHFEAVAAALPANPRVWYGLYGSYRALGRRERAQQALARLNALPESAEKHQAAAEAFEASGRFREAAAEWRASLDLAPSDATARKLVLALYESNDYTLAQPVVERALARNPDSPDWNLLRGAGLLEQQRTAEGLPFLEKAVRLGPGLSAAHSALGRAYLELGRAQDAIPDLAAAAATDPDGSRHYQLARAYQAAGRDADAALALRKSRELRAGATARK